MLIPIKNNKGGDIIKKSITICLDEKLFKKIERTRGLIPRSKFIEYLLNEVFDFQTADCFLEK